MLYNTREWVFYPNFNFGYGLLIASDNGNLPPPLPPVSGNFLLLDSTNFLLLDNTDLLLL